MLTYLDGDSGPDGWARVLGDDGLTAMAHLLREYHDAVAGFRPLVDETERLIEWSRGFAPTERT